jgi:hypothetical protein
MIPPLMVQAALDRGINLMAITDHNTTVNVRAVREATCGTDLTVLPGMELQTREEVHLLCLFNTVEHTEAWQALVDNRMPPLENNIEFFGEQFVVDKTGDFIRRETQLLLTSANLSLKEAVTGVTNLRGLAIPAHVNGQAFSLIANLGFVPPDVPFAALEISRHISPTEARKKFPQLKNYTLIQNGDVHYLGDFLGVNRFQIAAPTITELKLALSNQQGRSLTLDPVKT